MSKPFRVPHTLVLMFAMMIVALALTWILPAGSFDTEVNEAGREMVVPGTFETMEEDAPTLSPWSLFTVVPRALADAQGIIFFVLIIGGALAVIRQTGAIDALLDRIIARFGNLPAALILVGMLAFGIASATLGMAEEYIPFAAILIALCVAMRMDTVTAIGIMVSMRMDTMMPMAVTVSMRMATHNAISMAAKGMYSSAMPSVAEAIPKASMPTRINAAGRLPNRAMMRSSRASMAPVWRITASAPPMINTKKMMPWASARARGTTVNSDQGERVGASSSMVSKVPGTTISRPASLTSVSKLPAGRIQVRASATIIMANIRTSVCGTRNGLDICRDLPRNPVVVGARPVGRRPGPRYCGRRRPRMHAAGWWPAAR